MVDPQFWPDFEEEDDKIRELKQIVDQGARFLEDTLLSEREAREYIDQVRSRVLSMFPDKEEEFNLIYKPRFERLLEQNPGVRCDRALRRDANKDEG